MRAGASPRGPAIENRRRSQGGKGDMDPQTFEIDSHFVLWEAFFQTK